ncbi:bifunctional nicotinamidase/pyrazinamidase [Rhodospirillaceae bacterium RKSG073]|uniref:bifunctional nicotinamidase/pyrazinamidase n=1 Tax=Curvivirga aplysinae TaxID=2529852 RepID=UPI0012BC15CE|nr:bifunctional nicotinamidase/pyrazinamidase [Curvivirga aplysinae]MTI09043.1 bifunctional nicotinamidase/pyrazinamidase [Curvivirga aplysinae]
MDIRPTDALIVIDVQNDFCAGGALAVPDGDAVVEPIMELQSKFDTVVYTQDWHPSDHSSFASQHEGKNPLETIELSYGTQVLWPDHCVSGSHGAAFHKDLDVNAAQMIIRKGFRSAIDSYSAFFENDQVTPTGLEGYLKSRNIDRVFLCGLATDFCVYYSALDAVKSGFEAVLISGACRGIDLGGSLSATLEDMKAKGVEII